MLLNTRFTHGFIGVIMRGLFNFLQRLFVLTLVGLLKMMLSVISKTLI